MPANLTPDPLDPYAVLRDGNFRTYWVGHVLSVLAMQMQSGAIAWEVFERTEDVMSLGWIALAQVLPFFVLAIPAGQLADRMSRKKLIVFATIFAISVSVALALISHYQASVNLVYVCMAVTGIVKAIIQPAKSSFLPRLVGRANFRNAVTWATGGFQLASVLGPSVSGILIAQFHGAEIVYWIDAVLASCFLVALQFVKEPESPTSNVPAEGISWRSLGQGIVFVYRAKLIFSAILLDMLVVLFSGVTALKPVMAEEVLLVGPKELGWMQSAPAIGAVIMSILIAHLPPMRQAGKILLISVIGYGLTMVGFGLSRNLWLTLAVLTLSGALDMISVVIRHTLVQMHTPDELRGRVAAVNAVFISASNELGQFESSAVAGICQWAFRLEGGPAAVASALSGGVLGIFVTILIAARFSVLRAYDQLGGVAESLNDPHEQDADPPDQSSTK